MIKSLRSREDIAEAQKAFQVAFSPYVSNEYVVEIGYQGGATTRRVMWMQSLNIWAHLGHPPEEKGPPNRYWNVFGLGKPATAESIVCEINPPMELRPNPPAGVFARDTDGSLLILHRGRMTVTGGMKVSFVRKHMRAKWISFEEWGHSNYGILVAKIPSDTFGEDISHFVKEVVRVKDLARRRNMGFA